MHVASTAPGSKGCLCGIHVNNVENIRLCKETAAMLLAIPKDSRRAFAEEIFGAQKEKRKK